MSDMIENQPQQTNPTNPTETPTTPTQPMPNDPAARTETGELKDASQPNVNDPAKPEPKADAVPESYTFATGEDQQLDAAAIAEVTPIFKELGINQAGADKLSAFYNKQINSLTQRGLDAVNTMREGWRNEISTDPEIGGKLDSVKAEIGKLYSHIPQDLGQKFREAMDITGAGDNPAFVKTLYKLAQLVNEGRPVSGGAPSPHGQTKSGESGRPSMAQSLYPNLPAR